jgi:hypothetical protein
VTPCGDVLGFVGVWELSGNRATYSRLAFRICWFLSVLSGRTCVVTCASYPAVPELPHVSSNVCVWSTPSRKNLYCPLFMYELDSVKNIQIVDGSSVEMGSEDGR